VVFFRSALSDTDISDHFYADPAPEGSIDVGRPAAQPAANDPASRPFTENSSNRATKLKKARAEVKRLAGLVSKAQRWVGSLKYHHAPAKAVKNARAKLKSLSKQLAAAKKRVKSLS
jgi:hypothetical protein